MQRKNINEYENEMKTKSSDDTISNINTYSPSSYNQKNTRQTILSNSDSYSSNSIDNSQTDLHSCKLNKNKQLFNEKNDKIHNDKSKTKNISKDLEQNSLLLDEMILNLQKRIDHFQAKKSSLNSEIKNESKNLDQNEFKNLDQNQGRNDFLKSKNDENIFRNSNNFESKSKNIDSNIVKISHKVEKYIDAISNIDEKIHKCIQSIDSKISFLNQSKTDFMKIQNIIDLVKFRIQKEKKHHEIILIKYKNEFKRLARQRNDIKTLQLVKPKKRYHDDVSIIKQYNQILNKKEELSSELITISSKKDRSNDRLKRMESQLERLIEAESNIKTKLKKLIKRDEKESIITNLLDKLEQKLKEKQIKKEKEFRKDQIETQILLQTFYNLQDTLRREEDNDIPEQINLPDFPLKLIQNKNQSEVHLSKISDELNIVKNDIKLLTKEINKTKKKNDKFKAQISFLRNRKNDQTIKNNFISFYHKENVNTIYNGANDFDPIILDDLDQLSLAIEKKRQIVNKRKSKMLTRCEKYFTIIYEYGKNFQE